VSEVLTLYWRGPLDACNYGCPYCPFARRPIRREVLAEDRAALERFVAWVEAHAERSYAIQFTPWGEALIWPWYQEALVHLSHLPHVAQVGGQSNGSGATAWVDDADRSRLALWLTWHPGEVALERFLARVADLRGRGARVAAGIVAQPGRPEEAERLRDGLPAGTAVWVNAKRPGGRYTEAEVARLTAVDPGFPLDLRGVNSGGLACEAGQRSLLVEGDGTLRRCHLVQRRVGHLYDEGLDAALAPRPCPRARCDCYVGHAWLPVTGLGARGLDVVSRHLHVPVPVRGAED
jgi:hypothetical protein